MRTAVLLLLLLVGDLTASAQDKRRIIFHVRGAENTWVFLANYYGNKLFYTDSAMADANGTAVFEREKGYKTGVYAVLKGSAYVPFLVNEPELELETAGDDLRGQFVVKRSNENQLYQEYTRFMNIQGNVKDALEKKIQAATDPAEKKALEKEEADVDGTITKHQRDLFAQHPGTLAAMLVGLEMLPVRESGLDSAAAADDLRKHYWDNTDLSNGSLVRIPGFQNKLDEYFSTVVAQEPGAINAAADDLLERVHTSDELFKLVLSRITERYTSTEVPGNDAVFVHLAQTYYCPADGGIARATWKSKEELASICERARKDAPLVLGAKAQELILPDTTGRNWIKLSTVPADWTLVIFWSPHCSHCVSALPEIHRQYKEKFQALGLQVYAVAEASDSALTADWKAFVRKNKLDWINVGLSWEVFEDAQKHLSKYVPALTTRESLSYQSAWNAVNTPTFYLLDKDKNIAGKRLSMDQMEALMKKGQGK